ncbi:hypothetical protein LguiB_005427 [Lonicera macranthoides]
MKKHAHTKPRGTTRVNNQHMTFELKHRVVLALNKLADRDTYQIGVEDLEKTIECLNPDGVAPFLSCILDTDSEQKSAVRKECIRLMGVLTAFHEGLMGPHIGKMVNSIVKRLKDQDSVVRDACVETMGVLASKMGSGECESDGVFVVLVKPLFEALGEQNKQVQSGSALCLARVIDNTNDPPESILQRMLTRTVKLLKNPHFMAKPAVIELNRSIIQGGGAPTQTALSAAMTSIQEGLKDNDWSTRKAASAALGEIASGGGSFRGSFKSSCIRSLESCRFDKVKPVRDMVLQSLHLWRSVPGSDTAELSEAGSSIKGLVDLFSNDYELPAENFFGGEYGDITSASESISKDVSVTKVGGEYSVTKRVPLSIRKAVHNYVENENPQRLKENDWHVEIAVPKNHHVFMADVHNEESEGSSVTKPLERASTDISGTQYIGYEYVPMDDKQECCSKSGPICDDNLMKSMGTDQQFAEEISIEEQRYSVKMRDRRSLDSTITHSSSQTMNGCCLQTANEMISIRKQLLEIENKQSDLLDLLKVFTTSTMESLSMIQNKVSSLEHVVDRMSQDNKLLKRSPSIASPRISTCTPRSSIDIRNRPPQLPTKNNDFWEEKTFARSKLSTSSKQVVDMWTDPIVKVSRSPIGSGIQKSYGQGNYGGQTRKTGQISSSEIKKNSSWEYVKSYLLEGDFDSAYVEALRSGNELVLVDLLDKTGPVLESLSHKTANIVLNTLISCLREQRFVNYIVELSSIHGPNCLALSSKAKREILSGIQEAVNMGGFSTSAERRCITELENAEVFADQK